MAPRKDGKKARLGLDLTSRKNKKSVPESSYLERHTQYGRKPRAAIPLPTFSLLFRGLDSKTKERASNASAVGAQGQSSLLLARFGSDEAIFPPEPRSTKTKGVERQYNDEGYA